MGDRIQLNAARIDEIRILKGWTRSDLAGVCGFTQGTSTRVSRGGPVSVRTVRRLAEALGVEIREIVRAAHRAEGAAA